MASPIHVHVHIDLESATRKLDQILAQLSVMADAAKTREQTMTVSIQQIKDQADRALAAINNESDRDDAIIALVTAQTGMIAALKQQLTDAIASNDPAALQAVLDSLTAAEQSALANSDKVVAAVNANATS